MANRLTLWGIVGFMLAAIGAVVAATHWPETTTEFNSGFGGGLERSTSESGNEAAANFGLVMLGIGSAVLWVVVIAIGVYCGLRMRDEMQEGRSEPMPSRRESKRQFDAIIAEKARRIEEDRQRRYEKRAADRHDGR
jgi:hypothetical protein